MYTYVKGTDQASYQLGDIIYNPIGVYGQDPHPRDDGTVGYIIYGDIRPLYGDPITATSPIPVRVVSDDDAIRKLEGFWYLLDFNAGDKNKDGVQLEYVMLDNGQPVLEFLESGGDKAFQVNRTFNFVDMALVDVQNDLKLRTRSARDALVSSGYNYSGTDSQGNPVNIIIDTSTDGRQMFNNYYTQAVAGSQSISIFLIDPDQIVTLTGNQVIDIFNAMMAQINDYYTQAGTQVDNIMSAQTIYDAQMAATYVYAGQTVPNRDRT